MEKTNRLFNKNFNILVGGSLISSIGSVAANFALGLLVYGQTRSPLAFALFLAISTLPKVFIVAFAGPFIDTHSRKNIIVTLDYVFAVLFILITLYLMNFQYSFLAISVIGMGLNALSSVYELAYNSLFPDCIPDSKYAKAYSISSLVFPMSQVVSMLVTAHVYDRFGVETILLFNAATFSIVAALELFIKTKESTKAKEHKQSFFTELKEGVDYLKQERGLRSIFLYFFFSTMCWVSVFTVLLPYFEDSPDLNKQMYATIITVMTVGRIVGAIIQYFVKYPPKHRYKIAFAVYIISDIATMVVFDVPFLVLMVLRFIMGILTVTSFNIRMSSTQKYVPGEKRGRVHSIFLIITLTATLIAQLSAGLIAEYLGYTYVALIFGGLALIAVFFIIGRNRKYIEQVYNQEI